MDVDLFIEAAHRSAGIQAFDSDSFREGLEVTLRAIGESRTLDQDGRRRFLGQCARWLTTRLQVSEYIRQHPDIMDRPVERPIFIAGLPRTGTTVLSNLLGLDPANRLPLRWELAYPIPPAAQGQLRTDPRCLSLIEKENLQRNPFKHIHYEHWDGPTECHSVLAQDFKSSGIETPLASPIYGEWILQCGTIPTYQYHKRFLQVLQSHIGGQWILKLPSHALNIQSLLTVYPDAQIIWTHRDPSAAVASFMQMAVAVQKFYRSEPDIEYIREFGLKRMHEHVRRLMAMQDRVREDPFFHVFYEDLVREPIAQIRTLYRWLGRILSPEVESSMRGWIVQNPKNKHGPFIYNISTFNVSEDEIAYRFDDYRRRFSLMCSPMSRRTWKGN